jgi:hypothetical protein
MRLAALFLLLIALPAVAAAKKLEPPGLRTDKLAFTVTNGDGETLSFWWRHAKAEGYYVVFTEFRLGGGREFAPEMPTYRFGLSDPLETEWMRERERTGRQNWGDVEPARIWWVEWLDGENVVGPHIVLHSALKANDMTITYRTADGAEHTSRFDIGGFKSALIAATGMKVQD